MQTNDLVVVLVDLAPRLMGTVKEVRKGEVLVFVRSAYPFDAHLVGKEVKFPIDKVMSAKWYARFDQSVAGLVCEAILEK